MTQRSRVSGAVAALLLLGILLSACGAAPRAQNWPGVAATGDTVYVISGSPQKVYRLETATGVQMGAPFTPAVETKGVVYWSSVVEGDGVAFVGFSDSAAKTFRLYAFDPETGQELGYASANDLIMPAPVYADGTVYFGSSDGGVYAVDVESRQIKTGWPFEAEEAIWGSPLAAQGRVYVAAMDHYVYCLDAESGDEIWRIQLGGAAAVQPTLDIESAILYVGAFDGKVYAIDVSTDSPAFVEGFDFQAEDWIWSEVLLSDGKLFVTSLDGKLYALDPASGAVLPPYPYDSSDAGFEGDRIRAAPIQAGEVIVVATESGRVVGVKNATRQWIWPSGGAPEATILATPTSSSGVIFVALTNGNVQALDAATGGQKWTFASPEN